MTTYTSDKWVVIKIEGKHVPLTYKVFACWYGGYLGSNSWKLNSGITKVTKDGEFYLFEGHSGSVYKCHKKAYGMHVYGSGILNDIINKSEEIGVRVEILPEDTNWLQLDYN
jgi:hypothetical protein